MTNTVSQTIERFVKTAFDAHWEMSLGPVLPTMRSDLLRATTSTTPPDERRALVGTVVKNIQSATIGVILAFIATVCPDNEPIKQIIMAHGEDRFIQILEPFDLSITN